MKTLDYDDLESKFDCACRDVIESLSAQYKAHYHGAGPGKLETFLELIKAEFDNIVAWFTNEHKIGEDKEIQQRIQGIARNYAKKCSEEYGKIK